MQRDLIIKGRSLGGCSDLTLLAPIKPGFIDSLESVTYKTRIKRVLEALHGARVAAFEHHTARLLSDAVERVGAIHSVRVAVLEPENKVLLAVSFDGSWESYIRVLWQKVGTLLDLIFCGTVDYVTAHDHSFDEWVVWARRVQVETGFFYGSAESTARDVFYQRRIERMRARGTGGDGALDELRAVLPSAEEAVQRLVDPPKPLAPDDPDIAPTIAPRMIRERIQIGLQGLALLYRLTDLHRPGTPDGDVLRYAALDLLSEFVRMRDRLLIEEELAEQEVRFERQLKWLFPMPASQPAMTRRPAPPVPDELVLDGALRADVQAGILQSYPKVSHGAVLMLSFDGPTGLLALLKDLDQPGTKLTRDIDVDPASEKLGVIYRHLSFTLAGLRRAGLTEDELELFPEAFRQGMAARAGLLGDVRNNHPQRWRLPRRFAGTGKAPSVGAATPEAIELDSVHAVLQLRCLAEGGKADDAYELNDDGHPLEIEVNRLQTLPQMRLLAVQPLRRRYVDYKNDRGPVVADHFGYSDGDGQPDIVWNKNSGFKRNRTLLGEVLLGWPNASDPGVHPVDGDASTPQSEPLRWQANGSFLVMRKYRQQVAAMEAAVAQGVALMAAANVGVQQGMGAAAYDGIVRAKLMGRHPSGVPLIPIADPSGAPLPPDGPVPSGTALNAFTYDGDATGQRCPLHAHVRRAHPRLRSGEMARPPRLMRRSMSYGRPAVAGLGSETRDAADDSADRGLVFMAYNASLAEQFEVVQRWLVGGNSTGSSSEPSCPIVGVPDNGQVRNFRFEYLDELANKSHVFNLQLERDVKLFEEPRVLARLDWGLYLFTPSLTAIRALRGVAQASHEALVEAASRAASRRVTQAGQVPNPASSAFAVPWQLQRGRQLIADLECASKHCPGASSEAWKALLEDPESIDRLDSAAVWAVIRSDYGGVLRTPYGVLVASRELVAQVYSDPQKLYSVGGQLERMKKSFGEIALGMDDGADYRRLAAKVNAALMDLKADDVFKLAYQAAQRKIAAIVLDARNQSTKVGDPQFEVGLDAREVLDEVLASLSEEWFGIFNHTPGTPSPFTRGATDWNWKPGDRPLYPGHFTALSRYMFQPHPGAVVEDLGQAYGQALRKAMGEFVEAHRDPSSTTGWGSLPQRPGGGADAPIAKAIFSDPEMQKDDLIARTMVGVLMGFNPTIIGAVLNVLREWHRDGRIGEMRARLQGAETYPPAAAAILQAMHEAAHMRPMPQLGWRTARTAHTLGVVGGPQVAVKAGDQVVMGIVSGTQQSLADGQPDGRLMFGGVRTGTPGQHPTHACPGYEAGIGAMLGALAAMLGWQDCDDLRPGAAPSTFLLRGPTVGKKVAALAQVARTAVEPNVPARKPPAPGWVLAWGDSWFDFSAGEVMDLGRDLHDWLRVKGYDIPEKYCKYSVWPRAATMAADHEAFCADLDAAMLSPYRPIAILLSAGGNDSTGKALSAILNKRDPDHPALPVVDAGRLKDHIAAIRASYVEIVNAILAVQADYPLAYAAPILIHGYDHPIPQGKSIDPAQEYARKWMFLPFETMGYTCTPAADLPIATEAMKLLIDELNKMQIELQDKTYPGRFFHVDLRGTMASNPQVSWADDLHPTQEAFELMAQKLIARIEALRP